MIDKDSLAAPRTDAPTPSDAVTITDTPQKYAFVDIARGLAILLVIIVHHGQNFTQSPVLRFFTDFGQVGVQLFFVASAMTICMSFRRRSEELRPILGFYIRRFFRIAPLYYIGILFYWSVAEISAGARFPSFPDPYIPFNMLANVLFVHGFVPSAQNSIVPGGWSIGIEMTFYLIFPVLIFLYDWCARRNVAFAVIGIPLLAVCLNVLFQAVITLLTGKMMTNNAFLYFSIANQLPVFLVGISGHVLSERGLVPQRIWPSLAAGLAICALAMCWVSFGNSMAYTLLPGVVAVAFVLLIFGILRSNIRVSPVQRIGQVSYSMYLFHFPFAWAATGWLLHQPVFSSLPLGVRYATTLGLVIAGTYLVARISQRVFEDPSIRLGKRVIAKFNSRDDLGARLPLCRDKKRA